VRRRVPCHQTRGILERMMKIVLLLLACALLNACASSRYVSVQSAGGGGYYIAQTPPVSNQLRFETGYYSPFYAYGLYPWWGYTYYSPNFYPHYFALSYPTWPYYGGGYEGWYGGYPYGFAARGDFSPGPLPALTPAVTPAVIPAPGAPARVVAPTVVSHERDRQRNSWQRRRGIVRSGTARVPPDEPRLAPTRELFTTSPAPSQAIRSFDSVNRTSLPAFSAPPPRGSGLGGVRQPTGRSGLNIDRSPLKNHP
jgi:hypothetical protein